MDLRSKWVGGRRGRETNLKFNQVAKRLEYTEVGIAGKRKSIKSRRKPRINKPRINKSRRKRENKKRNPTLTL